MQEQPTLNTSSARRLLAEIDPHPLATPTTDREAVQRLRAQIGDWRRSTLKEFPQTARKRGRVEAWKQVLDELDLLLDEPSASDQAALFAQYQAMTAELFGPDVPVTEEDDPEISGIQYTVFRPRVQGDVETLRQPISEWHARAAQLGRPARHWFCLAPDVCEPDTGGRHVPR